MDKYYLVVLEHDSWDDAYTDVEGFDTLEEATLRSVEVSFYDEPVIIKGERVDKSEFETLREARKTEKSKAALAANKKWLEKYQGG